MAGKKDKDNDLSLVRPKKPEKGVKRLIRSTHNRGTGVVKGHLRRVSGGRYVFIRPTKRRPTVVRKSTINGKGYGVRIKRPSGKVDYRKHGASAAKRARKRN